MVHDFEIFPQKGYLPIFTVDFEKNEIGNNEIPAKTK